MSAQDLGLYLLPGVGSAWPELKKIEFELIEKTGKTLIWLPQGWLNAAQDLDRANPGALLKFNTTSGTGNIVPPFLNTPEKIAVWNSLRQASDDAQKSYAANEAATGRAIINSKLAQAAFWDGAYNLAVTIRDVPKTVISAAGDFASDVTTTALKKFVVPVAIIAGVALLWYNRGAISSLVGKKIASA